MLRRAPPRRLCVFCVQYVRANYDRFGREFFVPPGFNMPTPHADDVLTLEQSLARCPSCASMRHRSLFALFDGAHAYLRTTTSRGGRQAILTAPVASDAPRGRYLLPLAICVFCRRDQRRARQPASAGSEGPSAAGASAAQWEPDPDDPHSGEESGEEDEYEYEGGADFDG